MRKITYYKRQILKYHNLLLNNPNDEDNKRIYLFYRKMFVRETPYRHIDRNFDFLRLLYLERQSAILREVYNR